MSFVGDQSSLLSHFTTSTYTFKHANKTAEAAREDGTCHRSRSLSPKGSQRQPLQTTPRRNQSQSKIAKDRTSPSYEADDGEFESCNLTSPGSPYSELSNDSSDVFDSPAQNIQNPFDLSTPPTTPSVRADSKDWLGDYSGTPTGRRTRRPPLVSLPRFHLNHSTKLPGHQISQNSTNDVSRCCDKFADTSICENHSAIAGERDKVKAEECKAIVQTKIEDEEANTNDNRSVKSPVVSSSGLELIQWSSPTHVKDEDEEVNINDIPSITSPVVSRSGLELIPWSSPTHVKIEDGTDDDQDTSLNNCLALSTLKPPSSDSLVDGIKKLKDFFGDDILARFEAPKHRCVAHGARKRCGHRLRPAYREMACEILEKLRRPLLLQDCITEIEALVELIFNGRHLKEERERMKQLSHQDSPDDEQASKRSTSPPKYIPSVKINILWQPQVTLGLSIKEALIRCAAEPLTAREEKPGYLYVYRTTDDFRARKIGVTENEDIQKRMQEWHRDCHRHPEILYLREESETIQSQHIYRLEKLIHTELKDYRLQEQKCVGCNRSHKEWFLVKDEHIREVVQRWTDWMQTKPYKKCWGVWLLQTGLPTLESVCTPSEASCAEEAELGGAGSKAKNAVAGRPSLAAKKTRIAEQNELLARTRADSLPPRS